MPLTDLDKRKFEELVADALEHFWDYAYLGAHPLAELESVKQRVFSSVRRNHVETGRALNGVLRDAIETLKSDEKCYGFSREKHYHTILYKAYVESVRNKDIASSLHIGERTLYRYSTKAIQVVSKILMDWE
jgi:hypothetical protein